MRKSLASRGAQKVPWKAFLVLALLIQMVFISTAIYLNRGHWLYYDNTFYEIPAWNLVTGHGFSIPRGQWEDPYVTGLYHAAHPSAAASPDVPAVVFPPGYGYFLAAVYAFTGRSELAGVLSNGLLVLFAIGAMFVLVRRTFGDGPEAIIALTLIAVFPMWAFWASRIMSDTLHMLLVTLFAAVWFVDKPSARRTILAGLILALASLTRPYTVLLPVAFFAASLVFRLPAFSLRKVVILALITWGVFGIWTARNYYYFHKPIVVTSMGLGYSLLVSTYQYEESKTGDLDQDIRVELKARGLQDFHIRENNARIQQLALERIRQHPADFALGVLQRIPGLWFSLGTGLPRLARVLLMLYFILLFVTMLLGIFIARRTRNVVLAGSIVIVVYYWMVFAPLSGEGRYLLAARPFALLLSATAIAALLRRASVMTKRNVPSVETSVSYG